jgi:hypothetical protein
MGGPCGPGCSTGGCFGGGGGGAGAVSQLAFLGVEGGQISWDVSGQGMFDSAPLVMPGRQNFYQGALYRLKLAEIPGRVGVELYPTLEVAPVTPRTDAFLAHAPVPVQFTEEDLDQVLSGNFVTKVIYLPDPEFQELALAGVETLVSTRLNPGEDPIAEADRRGSILAILRIGNLNLQLNGQSMFASNPGVVPAQFESAPQYPGEFAAPGGIPTPYDEGEILDPGQAGPAYESGPSYDQGPIYDGGCAPEAGAGMSGYPQGMPTAGFAPQPLPPNMIAGMSGPQYGMPITGTPIGLPGPPHIPLGHQAGLTKHVMKNRTKVLMPPPVRKMKMTVKQRPGMNYPRPVNHVRVDEAPRAGLRLFGGTVPPALPSALQKLGARFKSNSDCEEEGWCP